MAPRHGLSLAEITAMHQGLSSKLAPPAREVLCWPDGQVHDQINDAGDAMGRLTTHVLDTAQGKPGAGIAVELFRLNPARERLVAAVTNADGRCERPLLEGPTFAIGTYELVFRAGDYFTRQGLSLPAPKFLDEVVIRFGIADAGAHYHVPLLISPYGYSTYRGS
jgi:5-hydroxyisourate hydrolase